VCVFSRSQRTDWRTERKLNSETFGVASARRGGYRGRGYYGNRGMSGGLYRGGNYRGGYRGQTVQRGGRTSNATVSTGGPTGNSQQRAVSQQSKFIYTLFAQKIRLLLFIVMEFLEPHESDASSGHGFASLWYVTLPRDNRCVGMISGRRKTLISETCGLIICLDHIHTKLVKNFLHQFFKLKFTKYDKVWHCSYIGPRWGPEKVFSK